MVGSRWVCGFLIGFDGPWVFLDFSWENSDGVIWVLCLLLGLMAYM